MFFMYIIMYMTRKLSIATARASLPSILRDVERGEMVEITRHGLAVAVLVSPAQAERLRTGRRTFEEAYSEFRSRYGKDLPAIDRDYFDALRDRSPGRDVKL
jgi:prevent-host-death family protein